MKCTGQELFNALTQREMIQIFTGTSQQFLKFPVVFQWIDTSTCRYLTLSWIDSRFDVDPDPTLYFDADPDSDPGPTSSYTVHKLENQKFWFIFIYNISNLHCFIFLISVISGRPVTSVFCTALWNFDFLVEMNSDPDRQALDADLDPAKWCRSNRIHIRIRIRPDPQH